MLLLMARRAAKGARREERVAPPARWPPPRLFPPSRCTHSAVRSRTNTLQVARRLAALSRPSASPGARPGGPYRVLPDYKV